MGFASLMAAAASITLSVPVKVTNTLAKSMTIDCKILQGTTVIGQNHNPTNANGNISFWANAIVFTNGSFDGTKDITVVLNSNVTNLTGNETYSCGLTFYDAAGASAVPSAAATNPAFRTKPGTPLKAVVTGKL